MLSDLRRTASMLISDEATELLLRRPLTRIGGLMLIYTLITLFVLPADNTVRHALVALPLFGLLLVLTALRARTAVTELLIGAALVVIALAVGHYDVLTDAVTVAVLLIFAALRQRLAAPPFVLDRRLLHGAALIMTLVLLRQFIENQDRAGYADYTTTLGIGDSNFSGVLLLLFLFFCVRVGFRPGIVLALAGVVLLLSRAYLIALLVYGLLLLARRRGMLLPARLSFALLLVGLNLILTVYAGWVLAQRGIPDVGTRGLERLVTFDDRSALARLDYNLRLLDRMSADPQLLWFGEGDRFEAVATALFGKVPHNSLFHLLGSHGLLMLGALLIALDRLFSLLDWRRSAVEIIPLIVYSLFLHGLFGKSYLLMIVLTLAVTPSRAAYRRSPSTAV